MPAPLGGIGQQVADNLFELGKATAQSAIQTSADVMGKSIEQILSAPSGVGSTQTDQNPEANKQKEAQRAEKKQDEKRQYNRVLDELRQYRERKQRLDAQITAERNREEQMKEQQIEAQQKEKKENFVQKLLHRTAGQAHGETSKIKE